MTDITFSNSPSHGFSWSAEPELRNGARVLRTQAMPRLLRRFGTAPRWSRWSREQARSPTGYEAKGDVLDYVERSTIYNLKRRHSTIGDRVPVDSSLC
jgi:hypothetical protein